MHAPALMRSMRVQPCSQQLAVQRNCKVKLTGVFTMDQQGDQQWCLSTGGNSRASAHTRRNVLASPLLLLEAGAASGSFCARNYATTAVQKRGQVLRDAVFRRVSSVGISVCYSLCLWKVVWWCSGAKATGSAQMQWAAVCSVALPSVIELASDPTVGRLARQVC